MPTIGRFTRPVDVLNYEILQEQASALGRLGRGLEQALRALRDFDAAHAGIAEVHPLPERRGKPPPGAPRPPAPGVVPGPRRGLRRSRSLMRDYQVPAEVQERMGAFPLARK